MSVRDAQVLDEFSRLNNEFANLQREVVKKNVELAKLNELKNRVLGMAAHDLRSPLSVIIGYAAFLEADAFDLLDEQHREFVTTIRETSEFMLRMVSDLLDVSAIEAGRLTLERHPTDLVQLTRRNVTRNAVLAGRKGITVAMDESPAIPTMALDPWKIEQVLNNLISNAVKFSHPPSTVRVSLSCAEGCVTLAVNDEGQGIPEADLTKLFKPFSKTSVRTTAGERSTGLGLAIVRNIVEGHGGRITVASEPGRGSTFSVILPLPESVA